MQEARQEVVVVVVLLLLLLVLLVVVVVLVAVVVLFDAQGLGIRVYVFCCLVLRVSSTE